MFVQRDEDRADNGRAAEFGREKQPQLAAVGVQEPPADRVSFEFLD